MKVREVTLFLVVWVLVLLLFGCETKKPYEVTVAPELAVKITAGPGPTTTVPNGAWVTFKWSTSGGAGNIVSYQYKLDGVDADWSAETLEQSVKYENLTTAGSYTFHVKAKDSGGATAEVSQSFTVAENSDPPVTSIVSGPEEGWKIAVGTPITFSWSGSDASPYFGTVVSYSHKVDEAGTWSEFSEASSVTLADVPVGDHTFYVKGKDNAGAEGQPATRSFTVSEPTILWIDDWYRGSIPLEFAEAQYYDRMFAGFAYKEYDMHDEGNVAPAIPTSITTVIWTTNDGSNAYNPWYLLDGGDRTWLTNLLDAGGNFLACGGTFIDHAWNNDPAPAADDFVAAYLGLAPDSTYDFSGGKYHTTWCTFVHGVAPGYPEEMKIDVGKDANQHRDGYATPFLKTDCTPLFIGGVDVDGDSSVITGLTVSHIYEPQDKLFKSAMINFPSWYMPGPEMRTTFVNILKRFGE